MDKNYWSHPWKTFAINWFASPFDNYYLNSFETTEQISFLIFINIILIYMA
jgi:hypothetical protein